jgi:hypothetical protein
MRFLYTALLLFIAHISYSQSNDQLMKEFRAYQKALKKETKVAAPKVNNDAQYRITYIFDSCTASKFSRVFRGDRYGYFIQEDATFINPLDQGFDRKKPGTKTEVHYASGKKVVYYSGFKSGSCKILVYYMEKKSAPDLKHDSIAASIRQQLDTAAKHVTIIMNSGEGSNTSGGKNLDQWNTFREHTKAIYDSVLLSRPDLFWSSIYVTLANAMLKGEQEPSADQLFYNRFMYTYADSTHRAIDGTGKEAYSVVPGDEAGGTFEEIKITFGDMRNEQTDVFHIPYPDGILLIINTVAVDPATEERGFSAMVIWFGK